MARVKRAQIRKVRRKKLFERAKGFHLARKNTLRQAHEAVMHAKANAFAGRKQRKRQFRALWITRISAALKPHGISYSKFMHGLNISGVTMNRKMLSELAIHEPAAFSAMIQQARTALAQ